MNTNIITRLTAALAATVLSTNLVLSLAAVSLAALVTASRCRDQPVRPGHPLGQGRRTSPELRRRAVGEAVHGGLLQRPRHVGRVAAAPGADRSSPLSRGRPAQVTHRGSPHRYAVTAGRGDRSATRLA